jgi:hypothetical protein
MLNAVPTKRAPKPNVPARMLGLAKRVSRVMEEVRLDACGSQKMNHLWAMDMLHDLRCDIYSLRIYLKNTKP